MLKSLPINDLILQYSQIWMEWNITKAFIYLCDRMNQQILN